MISPQSIQLLEKLLSEATPGPWAGQVSISPDNDDRMTTDIKGDGKTICVDVEETDWKLIVESRNLLPLLLQSFKESQEKLKTCEKALEEIVNARCYCGEEDIWNDCVKSKQTKIAKETLLKIQEGK